MNNLTLRIITGTCLVIGIILSLLGGFYYFSSLFLIFCVFGLIEFYRMATPKKRRFDYLPSIFAGVIVYLVFAGHAISLIPDSWLSIVIPIGAYFFLFELYNLNSERPFESIGIVVLGLIYVALPFGLLNYMVFMPDKSYNYEIVLACFIFLWSNDSGAYIVGRSIGKTKLFPRISPNKTIEGSVGGILLALAVAYFGVSRYFNSLDYVDWMVIAIIVAICGIYGDLIESMLKRSFNRKDSGKIFPGHGGVLDRFDSLILAAPMVYAYIRLLA